MIRPEGTVLPGILVAHGRHASRRLGGRTRSYRGESRSPRRQSDAATCSRDLLGARRENHPRPERPPVPPVTRGAAAATRYRAARCTDHRLRRGIAPSSF